MCHIDFDRLSFVPSVVRQGDFFAKIFRNPLPIKIILLPL